MLSVAVVWQILAYPLPVPQIRMPAIVQSAINHRSHPKLILSKTVKHCVMHYIRAYFIVIGAPYLRWAAFYVCCVAVIHNIIQYEVIRKARMRQDKSKIATATASATTAATEILLKKNTKEKMKINIRHNFLCSYFTYY